MIKKYCPLNIHSTGSLLESPLKIKDLVSGLQEKHISTAALTDIGNMSMTLKFSNQAEKVRIKPIIGQDFFICDRVEIKNRKENPDYNLIILARNEEGFKNLCHLSTKAYWKDNFFYTQKIDFEFLDHHKEGLIIIATGKKSPIGFHVLRKDFDIADSYIKKLLENYSGQFYLGIECDKTDKTKNVNNYFIEKSFQHSIPLVAMPNIFYKKREDSYLQPLLWAIKRRAVDKRITVNDMIPFNETDELYIKNYDEVLRSTIDTIDPKYSYLVPHIINNSNIIANQIRFKYKKKIRMPKIKFNDKKFDSSYEELKFKSHKWLRIKKFNDDKNKIYKDRIDFELSVIKEKEYADYFLIVEDFINWCKKNKVPTSPGRGSAAGSLVTNSLEITKLDPIKHKLKFERFLDLDRTEVPDIDLDIADNRRDEAIDYLIKKWGEDRVVHIGTFSTFGIRQAFISVCKVYGKEKLWDEIDKNLPTAIKVRDKDEQLMKMADVKIKDLIKDYPALERFKKNNEEIFNAVDALIGCLRTNSVHASAIIISSDPLIDFTPLCYKSPLKGESKIEEDKKLTTQFDMYDCEDYGLVKFDYLGLRSLRAIQITTDLIKENYNENTEELDEDKHLDDKKIYNLINKGYTQGIFQLETELATSVAQQVGVNSFDTMSISVALGRPGPINNGFVDNYENKRLGKLPVSYQEPEFEPILRNTLGEIVYQEQIMEISQVYSGYTKGESNKFRKAMGKKIPALMKEQEQKFLKGALKLKREPFRAQKLFNELAKFAEYGFNASHAKAYGKISCIMLWLKYYYPIEFFIGILTTESEKRNPKNDVIPDYLNECVKMGIEILPCDVNKSMYYCSQEGNGIRLGFNLIKHINKETVKEIEDFRPFETLDDFYTKTDIQHLNKRAVQNLAICGAFDEIEENRRYIYKYHPLLAEECKIRKRGVREDKVFKHSWIIKRRIHRMIEGHNKTMYLLISFQGQAELPEKFINLSDVDKKTQLNKLLKKKSPLLKIEGSKVNNEEIENEETWLQNMDEKFTELQLYLMERELMGVSIFRDPFQKHEYIYKKDKKIMKIRRIVEDVDLPDWASIRFMCLIAENKEIIDNKTKKPKGKLIIIDSSSSARTSIPVKEYGKIKDEIEEGRFYIMNGKIAPYNGGSSRYFIIINIEKKLE